MKQKYLIFALVFGLVAFTACSSNYMSEKESLLENNEINESEELLESQSDLISGNYQINPNNSQMTWYGYRLVGSGHSGVINIKSGSLQLMEEQLSGGEFVIDINSLKSDESIEALESHLKDEDFFNAAKYSEAKLTITNVALTDEVGDYQVRANLTIKDITAPIDFIAQIDQNGDTLSAEAEFSIDRTIWDLKYGSGKFFQDLGDKVISDDIDFEINLEANLLN